MISDIVRSARTIREFLYSTAKVYGDNPMMLFENEEGLSEESFCAFLNEINKLAIIFAKEFGDGQIVVLPGNLSKAWIMLFFAVLYSGNIAVPMDLSKVNEATYTCLNKLKPNLIFTERENENVKESLSKDYAEGIQLTLEEWYEYASQIIVEESEEKILKFQQPDDTAVLIFTSGTTGDSKIVELTHRNICADGVLAGTYMDASHPVGARILSALPVFHMYGVTAPLLGGVGRGFCICIGGGIWTFRSDIQKFNPEILLVVPQIVYNFGKKLFPIEGIEETTEERNVRINKSRELLGKNLKCIITGGAPIDSMYQLFFESIGVFLMNGYGITECSPIVCCDVPLYHKKGSIGKAGLESKLCKIKINEGEICVKGEIVSPGYWNDQEMNLEAYTDGWFRTGDLGYLDEDNYLYITGRKKNILILPDGNNISMDELEKELEKCPEVDSAIVLGSVVKETAVIKAIVYLNPENGKSESDSRMAVNEWIDRMNKSGPRYKRIAEFEITDKPFERTALGKIQKYKYSAG